MTVFESLRWPLSSAALKRTAVAGVLALCLVSSFAQTKSPPPPSRISPRIDTDTLATIVKSGKLRVGVVEIIPWVMHDKDGVLVGLEVDVARKLARDLGVGIEFHPAPLRLLIPDLVANRTDMIVGPLSIEVSRAFAVNFTNPYDSENLTLAPNAKSNANPLQLSDFNKQSVTIGASKGSVSEKMIGIVLPEATVHTYDDDTSLFNDLVGGRINAAVADSPRPEIVAKLFPSSVILPDVAPLGKFPAAFAVRRGDSDFVFFLNAWIACREDDHWLEQRRAYWFKTLDWAGSL